MLEIIEWGWIDLIVTFSYYYLLPPIFTISSHESLCIQIESASCSVFFTVILIFLYASQRKSKALNSHSQRGSSFCLSKPKPSLLHYCNTKWLYRRTTCSCVLERKANHKSFSMSKDKFRRVWEEESLPEGSASVRSQCASSQLLLSCRHLRNKELSSVSFTAPVVWLCQLAVRGVLTICLCALADWGVSNVALGLECFCIVTEQLR